jgi:hypothetical protein
MNGRARKKKAKKKKKKEEEIRIVRVDVGTRDTHY